MDCTSDLEYSLRLALGFTMFVDQADLPVPLGLSTAMDYQIALVNAVQGEFTESILDDLTDMELYLVDNVNSIWNLLYSEIPFLREYMENEWQEIHDYFVGNGLKTYVDAVFRHPPHIDSWNLQFQKSMHVLDRIIDHPLAATLRTLIETYDVVVGTVFRHSKH